MTLSTRHLGKVLQGAVSLLLIAFVVTRAGPASILEKMGEIDVGLLLTGFAVVLMQTTIAAFRWQKILRHLAIILSRAATMRAYFSAMFFNQLLPASLGGDLFKFIRIRSAGSTKSSALVAVLSERIFSLLSIVIMLVPALVLSVWTGRTEVFYFGLAAIAAVALGVGLLLAVDRFPSNSLRWVHPFLSIAGVLKDHLADLQLSLAVVSLSLVIQTMTVAYVLLMVRSLEVAADLAMVAAMVPFIFLAASVPVSLAGWGIREGAMVYGLGLANVGASTALAVSITLGFHLLLIGLLGAAVWLYDRHLERRG